MNRIRKHLHTAAVVIALLAATPSMVAAQDTESKEPAINSPHVLTEKKVRLNGDDNNVIRSGPGNSFAILGVYKKGEEFVVVAKRGEWYNVWLSDIHTGWIHSSLVKEFDDMSDLEFRPNPKLFSRVGAFSLTPYIGGYAFDRKSNSIVLGGRLGYYVLQWIEVEGSVGWTHIVRPAEIVESLFNLALEEEEFYMLYYALNANVMVLPGRQMVPFLTVGAGSAIMEGETESSINFGIGSNVFVGKNLAIRFEFRNFLFDSGTSDARRDNQNFEFSVGTTFLF